MGNQLNKLRDKLELAGKKYLSKEFLRKLIDYNASSYTVAEICNRGIVQIIKKGKYYINNQIKKISDPYIIGSLYFEGEEYVFGGLNIYNRYSFSTQITEWYTIYNTKLSGEKIIDNRKFIFIKQRESFFYGIEKKNISGYNVKIMSKERALIQIIKDNPKCEFERSMIGEIDTDKLFKITKKYSSQTVYNVLTKIIND